MQTQKILEDLIAIDSQCNKSNRQIIQYIKERLLRFEVKEYDYRYNNLDLHNLIVKIPGEKSDNPLVFVGHTDTVVASPEWSTNPFESIIKDGRIYGLGSSDMKAGLACMISSALSLEKKPKQDVYLLFDADEEDGGSGGNELIRVFDLCNARTIVAEPTDRNIVYAQKGCLDMEFIFKGKALHSSKADLEYCLNNSAIYKALNFSQILNQYSLDIEKRKDPLLGKPTLNIGLINGGTGSNIVAERCTLKVCRRLIGSENIDDEEIALTQIAKQIDSSTEVKRIFYGKPFLENSSSDLILNLQSLSKNYSISGKLNVGQGWTEASLFGKYGSVVIFGPGKNGVCHKPDEFVEIMDIDVFTRIYSQLMGS